MNIYPTSIAAGNQPGGSAVTGSEREVFRLFRQADYPEATVLHSLRFLNAGSRPFGQTDFLLVGPMGLVVFEVKGGSIRKNDDGSWTIGSEEGKQYTTWESPLDQASRNSMSIRDWLASRVDFEVKRIPVGHAVILPYQNATVKGLDVVPQIVGMRKNVSEPAVFLRWVKSCCAYWWKKKGFAVEALSSKEIANVVELLRGKFEVEPAFDLRTGAILDLQDTLSVEQVRILDAADSLPRIVVAGGAGSGKSFVIRTLARRLCEMQVDVGILVPRPELKLLYPGFEESGGRFHIGKSENPSDVLLVDEGQDFCNETGLALIDRCVSGGLANGRWRIFLDDNLQARLRGLWNETDFDLLKLYAGEAVLRLADNYRNTDKIVTAIQLAVPAKIGRAQVSAGVDCQQYDDGPQRVVDILKKFKAKGVGWREMCVIVLGDIASVQPLIAAEGIPQTSTIEGDGVLVAGPEYIQGLEYPHVVVFFGDPNESKTSARFYVAASRARATLSIVDPGGVYLQLVEANIQ
jgi:hypothetical protein